MNSNTFYCRICFTSSENILRPIKDQIREYFYTLTNIELLKTETHSNLICSKCDKKIQDTKKYCDELKANELQLMGKLDEIIFEEAQDEFQSTSEDQINYQDDLIEMEEVSNSTEDLQNFQEEIIEDITEEEEICEGISLEIAKAQEIMDEMLDDSSSDEAVQSLSKFFREIGEKTKNFDVEKNLKKKFDLIKEIRPKVSKSKVAKNQKYFRNPQHGNQELEAEIEKLSETSDGKVNCLRCFKTLSKYNYRAHVERVHFNIKNFICDQCGKQFYLYSSLEQHMNIHLNLRPYECLVNREWSFNPGNNVRSHVNMVQNEFVCDLCEMGFNALQKLENHTQVEHQGLRFKCPHTNCNLEYSLKRSLNCHIEDKHEIRKEPCIFCGEVGSQMLKHKRHIQNSHMRKFYCVMANCSAILQNRDAYRAHIKKVHKESSTDQIQKLIKISQTQPIYEINEDEQLEEKRK